MSRVFVAGATGAVGKPLVPLLVEAGHSVVGMTRSPAKAEAVRAAGEEAVLGAEELEGIVLRYGAFYGPDTGIGAVLEDIRRRRFPIVGKGTGVWSFVHVGDAGRATVAAIEHGAPAVYNIVDDEPAPVSEWLPVLAESIGAKPPRRVPVFLARLVAGEAGVSMMTQTRGASNAKAKRQLGWELKYPSWPQGFRQGLEDA